MICAGVPGGDKGGCIYDYGGPLVIGGQLVGIGTWTLTCGDPFYPDVYSNVATLRSFITEQTGVQ